MSLVIALNISPRDLGPGPVPNHWMTMKAFTLALASTVLSITTLLNFSLSAVLSIALLPLLFTKPSPFWPVLIFGVDLGSRFITELGTSIQWQLYGVWFEPFFYLVYLPLIIDGALICSMPDVK
jgi:glycosylphosphatidylinositol transamidase